MDCFWQNKVSPDMRIRFNLKDRKYRRKWRGISGDNLGEGK